MISFISQVIHLVFLIPVIIIAARKGFETLYYSRSLIRLQAVIVDLFILYLLTGLTPIRIAVNVIKPFFAASVMIGMYFLLPSLSPSSFWMNMLYVLGCGVTYMLVLMAFASERKQMKTLLKHLTDKK